ncbi:response regulator [Mucilaginibacter sp.]|uniref:response regulator n=1 Tax=Mucilaginibacter sp. TaxID=1882438 RepID=UPI0025FDA1E3|nr:response regulator [Mucilaginibacter sp.]
MNVEKDAVRVCLIDDDQIYAFGFKTLTKLKGLNSQVTHFSNGNAAIAWLKNSLNRDNLPDVIFLDINMPVMDGWEFMHEFADIKPQLGKIITIYMLSSSIDLNDIYRARKIAGVEDYIFKPVNGYQLSEIINLLQEQRETKNYKYRS